MTLFRMRTTLAFLLLLTLLASACTPTRGRGRGGSGGGGDDDDAASNDDDAADDDDAAGGTSYFGSASGYLKAMDGGGECDGDVLIVIDDAGMVVDGEIDCGGSCTITFDGPYAFSEDSFIPDFDCSIGGVTPTFYEFDAWIWGEEGSYAEGSIGAYGETDYFSLSFSAYFGEG